MVFLQFLIIPPPPEERPTDLVDVQYVAKRFGCSVSSVYAGKCGTAGIKPVSRDPWRAVRAQVEAEHAKFIAPVAAAATGPKERVSLVRRGRKRV